MPTRHAFRLLLPLLALTFFATVFAVPSVAQTYTILHTFTDIPDGRSPQAAMILDPAGNLYGTTSYGGDPQGDGTIFRIDPTGKETILHYFNRPYGFIPRGGLTLDPQGNAYGTTWHSNNDPCRSSFLCGVVYKLDRKLKYTVLHYFTVADGSGPVGSLVRDPQGNLFGTTTEGGASNCGVIFKLDALGTFSVLYNFTGNDGCDPEASMIRGPGGLLYGTTFSGGNRQRGTVFRFDPNTGTYTRLHSFVPELDGGGPICRLVADAQGNLYGTTRAYGPAAGGTVFKLTPSRQYTLLHSFSGDGPEGSDPMAGLIRDAQGNLYGTTEDGGLCDICGTVFKLDASGNVTVLHAFDMTDGERLKIQTVTFTAQLSLAVVEPTLKVSSSRSHPSSSD